MAKYTNGSSVAVNLNGNRLEPGEFLLSDVYLQNLPAGVVEDTSVNVYDSVIDSAKITSSSTYTLPATTTGYRIQVFCTSGEVSFVSNVAGNKAVLLGPGMVWERYCMNRTINSLIFTISSGTAYINVAKA